jgi:uncharacterized protein YbcI
MVAIHRAHFGRGPQEARTIVADGIVVCVMTGVYTPVERTLIEAGDSERVRESRLLHQKASASELCEAVERISGSSVVASASSVHFSPDMAIETFVLERVRAG